MEIVSFSLYSYRPRISIRFRLKLHTVPVVGDYIKVRAEHVAALAKDAVDRDSIKEFGVMTRVVSRTKYLTTRVGEDWRIDLELEEPLKTNKQR